MQLQPQLAEDLLDRYQGRPGVVHRPAQDDTVVRVPDQFTDTALSELGVQDM
nr:hypothetical protein [Streptomyces sp. UNOC14_S4]